jgi:hypothetical protein
MNSKILHLLYDVAEQVRDWAENLAESRNSNKNGLSSHSVVYENIY